MAVERRGNDPRKRAPRPRRSPGRLDRSLDADILEAALAGVAESGYDQLSMDDIASRARVGKAAIYRRWPSKAEVVADAIAHWRRGVGSVDPPNTGSLRGDIDALVAAVPDFDDADQAAIRIIVGVATAAMHNPVLAAALDDLVLSRPRQLLRVVLDHAVARGAVPRGPGPEPDTRCRDGPQRAAGDDGTASRSSIRSTCSRRGDPAACHRAGPVNPGPFIPPRGTVAIAASRPLVARLCTRRN
ncbi:putative HTH-type transcriptional regulator [Mycobacterium innocens]|uniref:Putative HTH-type transcriptional regulator n=1 Tax=Mycobacterium innocens TaxID=2341083 RepID=A0A498Q632_9MYCO|nr:putative HTH-type transcriptional regulator [Mycobacterium innocens]